MAEKQIECHATSSFFVEGELIESGTNLEIPEPMFKELRGAGRVSLGHVAQRGGSDEVGGSDAAKGAKGAKA